MLVSWCVRFYPLAHIGTLPGEFLGLGVLLPTGGRGRFAFRLFLPHCRRIWLCGSDRLGLLRLCRLRGCLPRLLWFFWSFGWAWLWCRGLLDSRFSEQHSLHSSDRLFRELGVYHPNARSPNTSLLEPPWGLPGPFSRAGPESISGSSCFVRFWPLTPVLLIWSFPLPWRFLRPVW